MLIDQIMRLSPVIPVLTIHRAEDSGPLCTSLFTGGLKVLEITLRTDEAVAAIRAGLAAVPDAIIGAGTVLNADDVSRVVDAGARFIVSPGLTQTVVAQAQRLGVPVLPGIANASDIMRGMDLGLNRFKFFPAETSGGIPALKALSAPFVNCRFCPTGGISLTAAPNYLALPSVLCIGGSWIAPDEAIKSGNWPLIQTNAQAAAGLIPQNS